MPRAWKAGSSISSVPRQIALAPYLSDLLSRAATVLEVRRIRVEIPEDLPLIAADYDRLERIFTNLLANALKYSAPGTPVVIRARQVDNQVEVSVNDQGYGIPAEDIPHLFERFYRTKGERRLRALAWGCILPACWWTPTTVASGWRVNPAREHFLLHVTGGGLPGVQGEAA